MRMSHGFVWLVVAALLTFSGIARAGSITEETEDCGAAAVWNNTDGNTDTEWTSVGNWQDAKLPTELSKVLLLEADAVAIVGNNDQVQVAGARIGSQSKLKITSGSKLTIFNLEVDCYDTNWCTGHGECVGVNVCQCDENWGGDSCDQKLSCQDGEEVTECGYCPEDNISCDSGDNILGESQEFVNRLLLLETNTELQDQIATTMQKLNSIKALNKLYNPYSEVLETEIAEWLEDFQEFADDTLAWIEVVNDDFFDQLSAIDPIPDPCDATEDQDALEAEFS